MPGCSHTMNYTCVESEWIDNRGVSPWHNPEVGVLGHCGAKWTKAETLSVRAIVQPWGRAYFLINCYNLSWVCIMYIMYIYVQITHTHTHMQEGLLINNKVVNCLEMLSPAIRTVEVWTDSENHTRKCCPYADRISPKWLFCCSHTQLRGVVVKVVQRNPGQLILYPPPLSSWNDKMSCSMPSFVWPTLTTDLGLLFTSSDSVEKNHLIYLRLEVEGPQ